MPTYTPNQLAAMRALQAIVDFDGKEEAHEFLVELGDMLGLWPAEQPLPSDDISKLAATLLCKGMTTVACRQRGEFLRAMAGHVEAGRRVIEGAQAEAA